MNRLHPRRPPRPGASPTRIPVRFLALALTVGSTACGDAPPALEVGPVAFSQEEVLGLSDARLATLQELVALGLAVERSEVNLLGDPLVSREEADHLWVRLQVEDILLENGVTESQLRAAYRQDPEFELTVRHLLILSERFESDEQRAAAREKARTALERIRSGEDFPTVAAQVSEEPGAEGRQGLLEPGRQGAWVDEFWNAASRLEVGEVSDVTETQYGFHVLRLEGRDTVAFQEVRPRVAEQVARFYETPSEDAARSPLWSEPVPTEAVADSTGELDPDRLNALDREADADVDVLALDGGAVRLRTLLDYGATLGPEDWVEVRDGTGEARMDAARASARILAVRQRAADRDITVGDAWRSARRADWRATVDVWVGLFGFTPGMGMEALKTGALEALGSTGQTVDLARRELHRHRGLLDRYLSRLRELTAAASP